MQINRITDIDLFTLTPFINTLCDDNPGEIGCQSHGQAEISFPVGEDRRLILVFSARKTLISDFSFFSINCSLADVNSTFVSEFDSHLV